MQVQLFNFNQQGDKEKQIEITVSQGCQRTNKIAQVKNLIFTPQGQIGFIKVIVDPLFKAMDKFLHK